MSSPDILTYPLIPRPEGVTIYPNILGYTAVLLYEGAVQSRIDAFRVRSAEKSPADQFEGVLSDIQQNYWIELADKDPDLRQPLGRRVLRASLEDTSKSYGSEYHEELDRIRAQLAEMTDAERDLAGRYCNDSFTPNKFRSLKEQATGSKSNESWLDWLSAGAIDTELMDFLEWHVKRMQELQENPVIVDEIAAQKQSYKEGIAKGIEGGWLHEDARSAIATVDGVRVFIGDIFETYLQDKGGYHVRGSDYVVITSLQSGVYFSRVTPTTKSIKHAAHHEFNHAVLGMFDQRWMDEALTEHIRLSLANGQADVMDPAERSDSDEAYVAERAFMAAVMCDGAEEISTNLATLAYSENMEIDPETYESKDGPYKRHLKAKINQSWARKVLGVDKAPVDFLDGVASKIALWEHEIRLANEQAHIQDANVQLKTTTEIQTEAVAKAHQHLVEQPEVFLISS